MFRLSDVFSLFQDGCMRGVSCRRPEQGAISVVQRAEEVKYELGNEDVVSSASAAKVLPWHNCTGNPRCSSAEEEAPLLLYSVQKI